MSEPNGPGGLMWQLKKGTADQACYRQHHQARDMYRVGRVERVQHVGQRDR